MIVLSENMTLQAHFQYATSKFNSTPKTFTGVLESVRACMIATRVRARSHH
jgi:hypothetical protein